MTKALTADVRTVVNNKLITVTNTMYNGRAMVTGCINGYRTLDWFFELPLVNQHHADNLSDLMVRALTRRCA